eukprot:2747850-Pleurochrysis_carterae.AAC.5
MACSLLYADLPVATSTILQKSQYALLYANLLVGVTTRDNRKSMQIRVRVYIRMSVLASLPTALQQPASTGLSINGQCPVKSF